MYTKEDPQYLIQLSPGLDLIQTVMLLFAAKTSFHTGSPFFSQLPCDYLPVLLMLTRPALSFEVGDAPMACAVFPIDVGSINVTPSDMRDLTEE